LAVKTFRRGNHYEDFEVGQKFRHHWGRTLSESDNILFTHLTMHFNPIYLNKEYAKRFGYENVVINPQFIFHLTLGMSVEDLSEVGGPFLGVDNLSFINPVYPGDTLYAESVVMDMRESKSKPQFGIVTWKTSGINQKGKAVIEFERRNLVSKRGSLPQ
jgi:acyl dehydratase